ncbi:MAG: Rossmann-like and DUF2520 domain-containing protein [Flavobacteriales bacterium]
MNILVVGTGNVANYFTRKFKTNERLKIWNWGRNLMNARNMSSLYDTCGIFDPNQDKLTFDLILIAVADKAIKEVSKRFDGKAELIVHTAGAVAMQELDLRLSKKGVFYPLQSISAKGDVIYQEFYCLIEADLEENTTLLAGIAKSVALLPKRMSSIERLQVHLAAVLVNNFTNHLFTLAYDYLRDKSLKPEILFPLIQETAAKLKKKGPFDVQTGPARRDDESTIKLHKELIINDERLLQFYQLFTQSIQNTYQDVQNQTSSD